jgi:two-component system sensor kinase FixL
VRKSPGAGNDIWPERLHPADLRRAMAVFDAHLRGREPIADVEFRLRCEDGTYRWVAVRGKVMERNAAGKALRMTGTVRDVHDRHLAVEREKRQAQELARAGRLIHVGEMATALAHELNQPLTAIRNFSGVVLRRLDAVGPLADPIREPLQMIAQQALRAGEIVHRVRGFVRKGRPVTAPVAIGRRAQRGAFHAARSRRQQRAGRGGSGRRLPPVLADHVQLEQVLANLIRNAIDAMAELAGERILRITAARRRRLRGAGRLRPGPGSPRPSGPTPSRPSSPPSPMAWARPADLPHHRRESWRAFVGRTQ